MGSIPAIPVKEVSRIAMKVTQKQILFADEYLRSGNAYQSAVKAGYSKNYAKAQSSSLLEKVGIKDYIAEKRREIESHKIADAKEVMEFYSSVMRGETKETVVVSTPLGMKQTVKEADLKTRIQAGKELMKRYPGNDPVVEQQLRKLKADARISEQRARAMEESGNAGVTAIKFVDDLGDDESDTSDEQS